MKQAWRDHFIAQAARAGLTVDTARYLLRQAATLQRLAEAQCNGDYPADNGQRKVSECGRCGSLWAPGVLKSARTPGHVGTPTCPDCRTEDRVRARLATHAPGWQAIFHGDPRGCVLKLVPPGVSADPFGDDSRYLGVPS